MSCNNPMTPLCGARSRSNGGKPCRRVAGPNGRCSNHGGRSTGPKTPEGKERQRRAVMKHGYWSKSAIAERKAVQEYLKLVLSQLSQQE